MLVALVPLGYYGGKVTCVFRGHVALVLDSAAYRRRRPSSCQDRHMDQDRRQPCREFLVLPAAIPLVGNFHNQLTLRPVPTRAGEAQEPSQPLWISVWSKVHRILA